MSDQMTLGSRIRQLRDKAKITQQELATWLGVTQGLISKLEGDRERPTRSLLSRVADLFQTSVDELVHDTGVDLKDLRARNRSSVQVDRLVAENHLLREKIVGSRTYDSRKALERLVIPVLDLLASQDTTIGTCPDRTQDLLRRWIFRVPEVIVQSGLVNFHSLYVHHLRASDEERALHDHPWDFHTYLLTNGYREHWEDPETGQPRSTYHPRGSLLYRPATWKHRLVLESGPCWTLIFRGKRWREWGFWPKGEDGIQRFMPWEEYSDKFCDPDPDYRAHASRIRVEEKVIDHAD